MALANTLLGSPRIHGELLKLGFEVSQRTVARLMPRRTAASSPYPSLVVSTTATSETRRSRWAQDLAVTSRQDRKRGSVLTRSISALTTAVAAPGDVQEDPSSAAPIEQLVGPSAVG